MKIPSVGLKAIISVAGLNDKNITIDDIVFKIGPRINAAGRIESGNQAVELLVSEKTDEAALHCEKINSHNQTRRNIDKIITEEAFRRLPKPITINILPFFLTQAGIKALWELLPQGSSKAITGQPSFLPNQMAMPPVQHDLYPVSIFIRPLPNALICLKVMAVICMLRELHLKRKMSRNSVTGLKKWSKTTISPELLIPQVEIDTELNFKDISPKTFQDFETI